MKHFFQLLLFSMLALTALNGCSVSVRPAPAPARPTTVVVTPAPVGVTIINARLNLVSYPNSQILELENKKDGSSKARFTTNANLSSVNDFFHRELTARGWSRTKYEIKSSASKVESTYKSQGKSFKFKLDREGNSGRYKLEIDFDNDDDDDDDDD
jgi:hypothetical protein